MSTVIIDIVGLEQALVGFSNLSERLTKLKPLMERFAEEFYSEEKSLFAQAPWKALTPAYAKRKREKFGDKPILRATDRLYKSLTEKDAEGSVHDIRDDGADVGSSVFYAVFHENTRNPLVEPNEERYDTIAGEYVVEMIRDAGFK